MKHARLVIVSVTLALGCGKPGDIPTDNKPVSTAAESKHSKERLADDDQKNHNDLASEAKPIVKADPRATLTDKQRAAVANALKALGRVDAAVEVGVNYVRYSELVIDAKAEVNEASQILPRGELLTNLSEAMDAYRDAGTVWNYMIKYPYLGLSGFGDINILTRYKLQVTGKRSDCESAMQLIWRVAEAKLSTARTLQ